MDTLAAYLHAFCCEFDYTKYKTVKKQPLTFLIGIEFKS